MELYSYQKKVLHCIQSDPSHSQLISMPTGTGKTITFLSVAKNLKGNTLILVHRQELLNQTYEKALKLGYDCKEVSLITSEDKQGIEKLTIAMVPTLSRNLEKYKPEEISNIIIDEAHHANAESFLKILKHFQVFEKQKKLLGFTATPLRGDKECLSKVFHSHSFKMTLSEATQNGYICPVYGLKILIKKSFEEIETKNGDYDISQLDKVINCEEINEIIAEKCSKNKKWPGVVFCTSIAHSQEIARKLREKKIKAISISHKTKKNILEKILKWFYEGRIEVITNAVKLSEGFDFPKIQTIVLARPTRSPVLYKQMIGRGLRKHENKFDCMVLEFSGNDEKMISWEDIDNNCTFQTLSEEQIKTREEALKKYKSIFKSHLIKIPDVKESFFRFYQCKIMRMEKYKKFFRYLPFDSGFIIYEYIQSANKFGNVLYNNFVTVCFWEKKYKEFYIWNEDYLYYDSLGRDLNQLELISMDYANRQPDPLGKWYPSEEDKMTNEQKNFIKKTLNKENLSQMSSRKAEMFIEDLVIKKIIDKFFLKKRTYSKTSINQVF